MKGPASRQLGRPAPSKQGRSAPRSACYSGGFVERLADPDSLVISSSASDRTSFGCSDEAELTDFARAYFSEALEQESDLVEAFEMASARIAEREQEQDLTPSRPQIAVGKRIARKLREVDHAPPASPLGRATKASASIPTAAEIEVAGSGT